jgi:hypothetical protein
MANRRFIDFPIASTVGENDIVLIWQSGANKQTTKATLLSGVAKQLNDLTDVTITSLANGQILQYDSVTGQWINVDRTDIDLSELGDVSIISPANGQVLVYNSATAKWENSSGGYVPYVGAVTTVNLGLQGLEAGFIRLDTSITSPPTGQGTMYWDQDEETVAIILNGSTTKVGEDIFFQVKNQSGSTIPKGTAVRFDGVIGASGRVKIVPFIANGSNPSIYFLGVTYEAIANGADGKALFNGKIRGVNTTAFAVGDILYASPTVAGGFTTTKPVAPNNIISVAAVLSSGANGILLIRPQIGSNINNDEGVKITSPTTGDLLQLQASGLWENKTKAQILNGTPLQFVKGDGSLDSTSYQPLLTNPITGTLATGQVAFGTAANTIGGDNGLFWDNTNKRLGVRTNAPSNPLQVIAIGSISPISSDLYSNAAGDSPAIVNRRSRGTPTSPLAVQNGDTLGGVFVNGYNGSVFSVTNAAAIRVLATENFSTSNQGTEIDFANTANGSTTRRSRLRIFAVGNVLIQNGGTFTDAGFRLDVNGTVRITDQLRLQSTITNGTSTYTLPSATGTLALTSELHDPVTIGTANGLSLSGQVLSLGLASGSVNGALSSTDWATFNNKIGGSGTTNYLAKFTAAGTVGDSAIFESGGNVLIGTNTTINVNGLIPNKFVTASADISTRQNVQSYFGNNASGPVLSFAKSRSGTLGALTYPLSGDLIGSIFFNGASESTSRFEAGASIDSVAGSTWTSSNRETYVSVSTVPSGSTVKSERLRITGAGNVGIGTDSPTSKLMVLGGGAVPIRWGNTSSLGTLTYSGSDPIIQSNTGNLLFYFGATEGMRLNSGGNLLINTTTNAGFKLDVNGTGRFSGNLVTSAGFAINANNGTLSVAPSSTRGIINLGGTTDNFLTFSDKGYIAQGSNFFQILARTGAALTLGSNNAAVLNFALATGAATFSSSVTATSFITSSDKRKKDIISQDGDLAIYRFKGDKQIHYGYIAQDMQDLYPNQVSTDNDGMLSLNYIEILVKKVHDLETKLKKHGLD